MKAEEVEDSEEGTPGVINNMTSSLRHLRRDVGRQIGTSDHMIVRSRVAHTRYHEVAEKKKWKFVRESDPRCPFLGESCLGHGNKVFGYHRVHLAQCKPKSRI